MRKWLILERGMIDDSGTQKKWVADGIMRIRSDAIIAVSDVGSFFGEMENVDEWCYMNAMEVSCFVHVPADDLVTILQGLEDGKDLDEVFDEMFEEAEE